MFSKYTKLKNFQTDVLSPFFGKAFSQNRIKKTALAVALSTIAHGAMALDEPNSEFFIGEAESVVFVANDANQAEDGFTRLSFLAQGREFNLVLNDNIPISKKFSGRIKDLKLLKGKIEGIKNSWARISLRNGQYTGAIFDGEELYMLDTVDAVSGAMADTSDAGDSNTIMYKASDVSSAATCGDHGDEDHSADILSNLKKFRKANASQATATDAFNSDVILEAEGATEQLNIRIVADTQYVATSNNGAQAQILQQMNIVDGIFSEQLGVQISIDDIDVLTNNGSLSSTNSSTLLNQFRNFVGNDNPGLAHLFTGRNLDGSTIGIAFLNGICRTNGVGVTQAGGRGTLGALTAAHELGHNFGAPHDNQSGSACAGTPSGFLMNPSLNGSDQFSACSISQMNNVLNRSSCLVDIDSTPTPTPAPVPTPAPAPAPTNPVAGCNLSTSFASGSSGFNFIDDAQTPAYSSGNISGGALNIAIGGIDNNDITNMQGAWRYQCNQPSTSTATITLNASLSQSSEYENNEISQIALQVNSGTSVLATLTGDGNGGPTQSTGVRQYTANVTLPAGTNTVNVVCFNNQKTFANETTNCSITDMSITGANGGTTALIDTDFSAGAGSFRFDASNDTYAASSSTGSALVTTLGGVDNADITNMTGSWSQSFSADAGSYTLSLDANLTQTSEYEANETSQIGVVIDGELQVLNQINGNGNGGNAVSTGVQSYELNINLDAGNHELSLYCANSEKTFANESTTCSFNSVTLD